MVTAQTAQEPSAVEERASEMMLNLSAATSPAARKTALTQLNSALATLSDAQLRNVFRLEHLSQLLDPQLCTDAAATELLSDILRRVLSQQPGATLVERCSPLLCQALTSAAPKLRMTLLDVLASKLPTNSTKPTTTTDTPLLPALSQSAGVTLLVAVANTLHSTVDVAQSACRLMLRIASQSDAGVNLVLGNADIRAVMSQVLQDRDATKRFRANAFIVELCCMSQPILRLVDQYQLLQPLLSDVDNEADILARLNALEMLSDMACGPVYCATYLHERGILEKLHNLLLESQTSPDGMFLFPAVIKFFGGLWRVDPARVHSTYPRFSAALLDVLDNWSSVDCSLRLLAFDTLAMLCSTPEGKDVVLQWEENTMKRCMSHWGRALRDGPLEVRTRHCDALIDLLNLKPADHSPPRLAFTQLCFTSLDNNAVQLLLDLFKQNVSQLHHCAGVVFRTIIAQPWGVGVVAVQNGFLDYLLDRSTEHEMQGRHIKFEIVELLLNAPQLREHFAAEEVLKLKEYHKQGTHYVQATTEVAVEGN